MTTSDESENEVSKADLMIVLYIAGSVVFLWWLRGF